MTDRTPLNTKWKEHIDVIVPYLRYLQCNGVEVLWRPLHEMNDDWCWWCGKQRPESSRKLYQITYEYMTYEKGLTNLIWVWNVKDVELDKIGDFYPGENYVDVVSLDPWVNGFTTENYRAMLNIAKDKPIAIAETAKLPTCIELAEQPRWTYFVSWAELVRASNTITEIIEIYNCPRVVNRGDIGLEDTDNVCIW